MSRWARPVGLNGCGGGRGIQPVDPDEARALLEHHGPSDDIEKFFGAEIEERLTNSRQGDRGAAAKRRPISVVGKLFNAARTCSITAHASMR